MKKIVQIYHGETDPEDLEMETPIELWGDTAWPSLAAALRQYPSEKYREVQVSE